MSQPLPDQDEAARRIRAALKYAGFDQQAAMKALNASRSTLGRLTAMKGDERKVIDWSDAWMVADVCGLPREWFSADFSRLHEIVPDGMPTIRRSGGAPPPAPSDLLRQPRVAQQPTPGRERGRSRSPKADAQ